jgi:hypothetical protein
MLSANYFRLFLSNCLLFGSMCVQFIQMLLVISPLVHIFIFALEKYNDIKFK